MAAVENAQRVDYQPGRSLTILAFVPAIAALMVVPDAPGCAVSEAMLYETVEVLMMLSEARDGHAQEHAAQVAELSAKLALALDRTPAEQYVFTLAGLLHDVGKVAVPEKPGVLTAAEWDVMRAHAVIGAEIVGRISDLRPVAELIRSHHERWDGLGYPDCLAGAEIPLGARVLAVADAYYAITTSRPYQPARDHTFALAEIERCSSSQFDPAVVRALHDLPVGELLY